MVLRTENVEILPCDREIKLLQWKPVCSETFTCWKDWPTWHRAACLTETAYSNTILKEHSWQSIRAMCIMVFDQITRHQSPFKTPNAYVHSSEINIWDAARKRSLVNISHRSLLPLAWNNAHQHSPFPAYRLWTYGMIFINLSMLFYIIQICMEFCNINSMNFERNKVMKPLTVYPSIFKLYLLKSNCHL